MPPSDTTFNHADCGMAHAVVCCHNFIKSVVLTNFQHVLFGQLVTTMTFTNHCFAKTVSVLEIIFAATPRKIGSSVVRFLSIVVKHLLPIFRLPVKSKSDKPMDVKRFAPTRLGELNAQIPARMRVSLEYPWLNYSVACFGIPHQSWQRPNSPKITNLVKAFIPRDRKPYFFHCGNIACVGITIK